MRNVYKDLLEEEKEKVETITAKIDETIVYWIRRSAELRLLSKRTWEQLKIGELPQEDEIIYSVYEDQAKSDTYALCARALQQIKESLK